MGILNCTPDSFSDGGAFTNTAAAIAHGEALIAQGAAILDIGGESTRPGARPVSLAEEWDRIGAVVEALAPRFTVSVDTSKAEIARRALAAGATIINDVSAGLADAGMLATVASGRGTFIAMHMRGTPATMQTDYVPYGDVVAEVRAHLVARVAAARAAGIREVWIDPGVGFGKSAADNWALTARLGELRGMGDGLVYGASRKGFLKTLASESPSHISLDEWTAHLTLVATLAGADVVRVHAPENNRAALAVASQLMLTK